MGSLCGYLCQLVAARSNAIAFTDQWVMIGANKLLLRNLNPHRTNPAIAVARTEAIINKLFVTEKLSVI